MIFNPLTWPTLLKVLVIFALLLGSGRLKLNLGVALLLAGAVLGLSMDMDLQSIGKSFLHAVSDGQTIKVAAIVALIMALTGLMKQAGQLDQIVTTCSSLVRSQRTLAGLLPALMGLLPMPGGALLSAPMVKTCYEHNQPAADLSASVNYWFRHHGEYWLPLYPGVILAVSLLGIPTWLFMAGLGPLAVVHLSAGAWFLLRALPNTPPAEQAPGNLRGFAAAISPILMVVAAVPIGEALHLAWPSLETGPFLLIGFVVANAWVAVSHRLTGRQVARGVINRAVGSMLLLVLGVMVFKGFLVDSGAVGSIQKELVAYGIAPLALVILLPFISGLLTGIAMGFVAASFPLVAPLFSSYEGATYLAYVALAFGSGFLGMMLSPVHLCFLVSRDFFKTTLLRCYVWLWKPLATSALALALWFWLLISL